MFDPAAIIDELTRNQRIFEEQLQGIPEPLVLWKPTPKKWCILEIICHLYDEEREDFRARLRHVLQRPHEPMPSIDPQGWVESRQYMQQDFGDKREAFLAERAASITWLRSLNDPAWDNTYEHRTLGALSGKAFLSNWLAHDYIHIRQINRNKMEYLASTSGQDLTYAGNW